MRVYFVRSLSLAVCLGLVANVIAAPPEKDAKPEVKTAAAVAKKDTEKKAHAAKKPAVAKKAEDKKPEVTKPEPVKVEVKAAEKKVEPTKPAAAKVEAKPAVAEKKPATATFKAEIKVEAKQPAAKSDDKKPVAAKPAAKPEPRKPTRVDPADNATQPTFTSPAKPAKALTPGGKYVAGDMSRPRPTVISPPSESNQNQPGRVPSDAIVLFDGATFDRWKKEGGPKPAEGEKPSDEPLWVIKNGYMECQPRSGGIGTRDSFGDCQLHIEWATPSMVKGNSQGRGNSGVLLHGLGEVQVLDSYENDTYPDGQASAIYGKYPPLVNASRRPGEWQTYDIIVELAKVDPVTKQLIRPARLTVLHNGVLTHIAAEIPDARTQQFSFGLQDHGNPVRYRNIWLRPLTGYDAAGDKQVVQATPAAKVEVKAEAKAAEIKKPIAKPTETKKPEATVEVKADAKPAAKPEVKPPAKPAEAKKPEAKPAAATKKDDKK